MQHLISHLEVVKVVLLSHQVQLNYLATLNVPIWKLKCFLDELEISLVIIFSMPRHSYVASLV